MSKIHNSIFGIPSGRVGDLIFRRRRGKVFMYAAPIPYEREFSEAEKFNQTRFAFLRRAAACINREYFLKGLWDSCSLPGGAGFERQMKCNRPFYNNFNISKMKLVPPDDLFPVEMTGSSFEEMVLSIVTGPVTTDYLKVPNLKISAHGMMLISGMIEEKAEYLFLPLTSEEYSFIDGSAYTFHLPVKCDYFESINQRSFAVSLIIKDENGAPVRYSVNLAGEV